MLERAVSARMGAVFAAARRSGAGGDAGIARPTLYAWCRDRLAEAFSGRGDGDQAAVIPVPGGKPLAGIRSIPSNAHGSVQSPPAGKPAQGSAAVLERGAGYGRLGLS